jgi:putative effector of murein hydrolase LrgA (UPF0299 family)
MATMGFRLTTLYCVLSTSRAIGPLPSWTPSRTPSFYLNVFSQRPKLKISLSGIEHKPEGTIDLSDTEQDMQQPNCTSKALSTADLPRSKSGLLSSLEADFVKTNAQIFVGTAVIFALERSLWAAATAAGVKVPTAPAGMLLVFAALLVTDAINPTTARRISDFFNPARTFYSLGVPLFFMPPLVQLPLSLGMLPLLSIVKYLTLIATGTIISIIVTGLAVSAFAACPAEQPRSEWSATHILPHHRPKINSFKAVALRIWHQNFDNIIS